VGTIIGTVKKSKVITGEKIKPGDVVIGLPSGGLQTTNAHEFTRLLVFYDRSLKIMLICIF